MTSALEDYFGKFRENIVGINQTFTSPYGIKKIIYGDWIASGRLYHPIEEMLIKQFGPFVGNTHTDASETGVLMTKAYHYAQHIIKEHVNAGPKDVIINAGSGMTTVINKLQTHSWIQVNGKILQTGLLCPARTTGCVYHPHGTPFQPYFMA